MCGGTLAREGHYNRNIRVVFRILLGLLTMDSLFELVGACMALIILNFTLIFRIKLIKAGVAGSIGSEVDLCHSRFASSMEVTLSGHVLRREDPWEDRPHIEGRISTFDY